MRKKCCSWLAFNDFKDYSVIKCRNPSICQGTPEQPSMYALMSFVRHHLQEGKAWMRGCWRCWGMGRITQKWHFCLHYLESLPQFSDSLHVNFWHWIFTLDAPMTLQLVSEPLSVHVVIFVFSDSNLVFYLVVPTCIWYFLFPLYLSSGQVLHPAWSMFPGKVPGSQLTLSHFSKKKIPVN